MFGKFRLFYSSHKKIINLILQFILLFVIGWLLAGRIKDSINEAFRVVTELHWQLFAATGLFTLAVPISGLLWGQLLREIYPKSNINHLEAARVHIISWLLKYIPGQAGSLLSKIAWAQRTNTPKKVAATSILYENIFLASSSLLLSLPFLGLAVVGQIGEEKGLLVPLVLALSVVPLLVPSVFAKLLLLATKLARKKSIDSNQLLNNRQVLENQILYLIPRIINGIGFVLIASIFVSEFSVLEGFQLVGAYALAGILGILAFFVPSGLGVREAVIIVAAGPILGTEFAVASAILARVCATIADGILVLIYGIMRFNYGK